SRRRNTRCYRDWSSDVCSSDLFAANPPVRFIFQIFFTMNFKARWLASSQNGRVSTAYFLQTAAPKPSMALSNWRGSADGPLQARSEERRVGKEWRCRGETTKEM